MYGASEASGAVADGGGKQRGGGRYERPSAASAGGRRDETPGNGPSAAARAEGGTSTLPRSTSLARLRRCAVGRRAWSRRARHEQQRASAAGAARKRATAPAVVAACEARTFVTRFRQFSAATPTQVSSMADAAEQMAALQGQRRIPFEVTTSARSSDGRRMPPRRSHRRLARGAVVGSTAASRVWALDAMLIGRSGAPARRNDCSTASAKARRERAQASQLVAARDTAARRDTS